MMCHNHPETLERNKQGDFISATPITAASSVPSGLHLNKRAMELVRLGFHGSRSHPQTIATYFSILKSMSTNKTHRLLTATTNPYERGHEESTASGKQ